MKSSVRRVALPTLPCAPLPLVAVLVSLGVAMPSGAASASSPDPVRSMLIPPSTDTVRVAQPLPATTPAAPAAKKPPSDWPKVLPKPNAPPPVPEWTEAEIAAERARCTALLKGSDIVAIPASPIRENECGAAAPVEIVSVGRNPQVAFSPPALVTCDMAVAMSRWVGEVQPVARKFLGAEMARIDVMSAYSCRNAYGRKGGRLSEHGKANALDIRGFTFVNGVASDVLDDWGPTGRDIRAQVAAAKAAAKKAEAERAATATLRGTQPPVSDKTSPAVAANPPARQESGTGVVASDPSAAAPVISQGFAPPAVSIGPRDATGIRIGGDRQGSDRGVGLSPVPGVIGRLGGPKPDLTAPGPTLVSAPRRDAPSASDKRMQFHRAIHGIACRIFGTVLGPEANEAHRNHYHFDLAERRSSSFCE
ncbi:MAG TPA: extensin family protein [Hyphomicrobiaceae bacterium]|nr:extensin family protein [Hyphomicrobiaceae bacterium]